MSYVCYFFQTLNGKNNEKSGGLMIFITDGEFWCPDPPHGQPGYDIRNKNVIKRIEDTKVRIISVAIGLVQVYTPRNIYFIIEFLMFQQDCK